MRLLILGARGFVGAAVSRRAAARGWTVGAASRPSTPGDRLAVCEASIDTLHAELSDAAQIARLVEGWRPDAIVQAAFAAGHGTDDAAGRLDYFQRGVAPALALAHALESVRYAGTLVHAGSAMSFGDTGRSHAADDRLAPTTPRGVVKATCALIYEQAACTTGFRLCELFIYTVYGPWEQRGRLIPSLLRAALEGGSIRLTPTSHPRNWVHVDDVAEACIAAAARTPAGVSRVIVGSDRAVATTHEIAAFLETLAGRPLVRDYTLPVVDRYGDKHLSLDPAHGLATIGWTPSVDLPSGLRTNWEWAATDEGRRHLLA